MGSFLKKVKATMKLYNQDRRFRPPRERKDSAIDLSLRKDENT
jgi:hypothetical protein